MMLTLAEKDRNAHVASPPPDAATPENESPLSNIAKDYDTEQLQSFFSGLMNRTAGGG